jgi:type I restriction-modification system DNA methylase subunit
LLKTDLLGDTIESALSETGGTKDIGLFRTPDHIRQFMTALVEPTFSDIIFDPACGTGGFLFDTYEFVMQRYLNDKSWPGEKGHTELKKWFAAFFEKNPVEMPSEAQSKQFYRSGVSGIEYLGMIRKMAAINFYIRGLNPGNIEQGDSLAKYNPVTDHESKSIVLANPPFGAERDQESYPEVWSEYSKESETTILFVKLMFELLKQGGKCAVIVSEGFHTWDQFSAKAIRKMLLDEAKLIAVISLPQGLFISKSGQGPKTSILIYEKGGRTDWVWFYKITNDGFTMGTNRKEQKGNQLVDCLNLFHQYVKNGNQPPETKNQFCIPVEWIKTLDPRIKERIRVETRSDMESKGNIERSRKVEDLDRKVKIKKITNAQKLMELKIFDQSLENRIQNEIAKRIDKAHSYSFSLSNYKSGLSESQIAEWKEAMKHVKPNGAATLDEVYKKLYNSTSEEALPYLLKLNPINTLEADIAREYVCKKNESIVTTQKELATIKEILKSGAKYPSISIKESCTYEKGKLATQATPEGVFPFVVTAKERKSAPEYQLDTKAVCIPLISSSGHGSASLNRIHYQEGKFALANLLFAAIPKNPETELYPKFLYYILDARREELFCPLMKGTANVAMKMEDAVNIRFPLPEIEIQKSIVVQIEKQKAIIEGAKGVLDNFEFRHKSDDIGIQMKLGDVCSFEYGDPLIEDNRDGSGFPVYGSGGIIGYNSKFLIQGPAIIIGRKGSAGVVHWSDKCCWPIDTTFYIKPKIKLNLRFLYILLKSLHLESLRKDDIKPGLNRNDAYKLSVLIPNTDAQDEIVSQLNSQMQVIEGLHRMKIEAEKEINQILIDVWGIDSIALKTQEVEE